MATDVDFSFALKDPDAYSAATLTRFLEALAESRFVHFDNDVCVYDRTYTEKVFLNSIEEAKAEIERQGGGEEPPYFLVAFAGHDTSGPENGVALLASEIDAAAKSNAAADPGLTGVALFGASVQKSTTEYSPDFHHTVAGFAFRGSGAVDAAKLHEALSEKQHFRNMMNLLRVSFGCDVVFSADPAG